MKKFIVLLLFCLPLTLAAMDFGMVIEQYAVAAGAGDESSFDYQAEIIPRLSGLLGDTGEFIITAGMTVGAKDGFYYVPELLRTELSGHFGRAKLTFGRMRYTAPIIWVADGLFDGLQFSYNGSAGIFSAGAWYTGLLYKKKANIIMTEDEIKTYNSVLDYGDFANTYFASRRVVAALGWEHPAVAELVRTKLAVIAQFDLNDAERRLNSQYFTAKIGVPAGQFLFELGGALQLAQTSASGGDSGIGIEGELGAFWALPANFPSRISFNGYFFSGNADGSPDAFIPVTTRFFGDILEARPSGITVLGLGYTARFHKTFSASLTSSYFIRNDLGTYKNYPIDVTDGEKFFLGNEFFARLTWSPFSDLQINLGGGVFLPSMGNAAPDREPMWQIKLAVALAVF